MNERVNIICLYWVGEFRGRDFSPMDVLRLFQSVYKHCDRPFDFYVLTNDMACDVPGKKLPLLHGDNWPGWWAKMELHREDLPTGRTLYMDLDSHAIRSLGPILDTPGDLVMFNTPHPKKPHIGEDGIVIPHYQAATMLFDPGKFVWMYKKFLEDWDYYLKHYRSDQDIMAEWIPNQPTFPDEWMVKLSRIIRARPLKREPPPEAIIVTGQPKNGAFRKTKEVPWLEKMAR